MRSQLASGWCLPLRALRPDSHAHFGACRGHNAREYEHTGPGERLVSVQFAWGAEVKDVSSIWVGTSPEFEMALYTLVRAAQQACCSGSAVRCVRCCTACEAALGSVARYVTLCATA